MLCFDCRSVICYCSELVSLFFVIQQLRHLRYFVVCLLLPQIEGQLDSCLASQLVSQWVQILLSTPYSRTSATDAAVLPSRFDNGIKYNEPVYRKYQNICLETRQAPHILLTLCLHTEVQDEVSVSLTRVCFCVSN